MIRTLLLLLVITSCKGTPKDPNHIDTVTSPIDLSHRSRYDSLDQYTGKQFANIIAEYYHIHKVVFSHSFPVNKAAWNGGIDLAHYNTVDSAAEILSTFPVIVKVERDTARNTVWLYFDYAIGYHP